MKNVPHDKERYRSPLQPLPKQIRQQNFFQKNKPNHLEPLKLDYLWIGLRCFEHWGGWVRFFQPNEFGLDWVYASAYPNRIHAHPYLSLSFCRTQSLLSSPHHCLYCRPRNHLTLTVAHSLALSVTVLGFGCELGILSDLFYIVPTRNLNKISLHRIKSCYDFVTNCYILDKFLSYIL